MLMCPTAVKLVYTNKQLSLKGPIKITVGVLRMCFECVLVERIGFVQVYVSILRRNSI